MLNTTAWPVMFWEFTNRWHQRTSVWAVAPDVLVAD
jgi:hypothetical protein